MDHRWLATVEALYREMYGMMVNYAKHALLGDGTIAEEAVQETFRIAVTKAAQLSDSENPRGWLINTLKNVLTNMRREQARAERLLRKAAANAAQFSGSTAAEITDLIGDEDIRLLRRVILDGFSTREAAYELNISVEACKKRIQRAKARLREAMEEDV